MKINYFHSSYMGDAILNEFGVYRRFFFNCMFIYLKSSLASDVNLS